MSTYPQKKKKGEWIVRDDEVCDAAGNLIARVSLSDYWRHNEEFARRIVEDHNALIGLNPKKLVAVLDACDHLTEDDDATIARVIEAVVELRKVEP